MPRMYAFACLLFTALLVNTSSLAAGEEAAPAANPQKEAEAANEDAAQAAEAEAERKAEAEQAAVQRLRELLQRRVQAIEIGALKDEKVAAARKAAMEATRAYDAKYREDPKTKELMAKQTELRERVNAMRTSHGRGRGNWQQRMREGFRAMQDLREVNNELKEASKTVPEIEALRQKKQQAWVAFGEALQAQLKNNDEYQKLTLEVKELEQWERDNRLERTLQMWGNRGGRGGRGQGNREVAPQAPAENNVF